MRRRGGPGGFTLIESMVAVGVAGVLAAVAMPGIEGVLHRVRRADAVLAAFQVQLAQERHRGRASSYGSLADIGLSSASAGGHYGLEIGAHGADGYDLSVRATGVQARDAPCRYLRLRLQGSVPTYASGPDLQVANDAPANRRCWNR